MSSSLDALTEIWRSRAETEKNKRKLNLVRSGWTRVLVFRLTQGSLFETLRLLPPLPLPGFEQPSDDGEPVPPGAGGRQGGRVGAALRSLIESVEGFVCKIGRERMMMMDVRTTGGSMTYRASAAETRRWVRGWTGSVAGGPPKDPPPPRSTRRRHRPPPWLREDRGHRLVRRVLGRIDPIHVRRGEVRRETRGRPTRKQIRRRRRERERPESLDDRSGRDLKFEIFLTDRCGWLLRTGRSWWWWWCLPVFCVHFLTKLQQRRWRRWQQPGRRRRKRQLQRRRRSKVSYFTITRDVVTDGRTPRPRAPSHHRPSAPSPPLTSSSSRVDVTATSFNRSFLFGRETFPMGLLALRRRPRPRRRRRPVATTLYSRNSFSDSSSSRGF